MCFSAPKTPATSAMPGPVKADEYSAASSAARLRAIRQRGVAANIFTSPLGASGFDTAGTKAVTLTGAPLGTTT